MSPVSHGIVQPLAMLGDTLIPKHYSSWLILHPITEVVVAVVMIEKERQQVVDSSPSNPTILRAYDEFTNKFFAPTTE